MSKYIIGMKNIILISCLICLSVAEINSVEKHNHELNRNPSEKARAPCPNANSISPCVCTADANGLTTIDCSSIESDQQLRDIFSALPSADYHILNIENNEDLTSLSPGVFGTSTFVHVYIKHVPKLVEVDLDIFLSMTQTLQRIFIDYASLTTFDYDFKDYPFFTFLSMKSNKLSYFKITSQTLLTLMLEYNELSEHTFINDTPQLTHLYLPRNNFDELPHKVSHSLLTMVYFNGNNIHTLHGNTLCHVHSLDELYLGYNQIVELKKDSICIIEGARVVSLVDNQLTKLEKDVFEKILINLDSNKEGLELSNNPLECGCDVAWIFEPGTSYLAKISLDTTCASGTYFHDLDINSFDC